jgi:hypothetical protein
MLEELVFPQESLVAELTAEWGCGPVDGVYMPLLFVLAVKGFGAAGDFAGYAAEESLSFVYIIEWKVKRRYLLHARFERVLSE